MKFPALLVAFFPLFATLVAHHAWGFLFVGVACVFLLFGVAGVDVSLPQPLLKKNLMDDAADFHKMLAVAYTPLVVSLVYYYLLK